MLCNEPELTTKIDKQISYFMRRFGVTGTQDEGDFRQECWVLCLTVLRRFQAQGSIDGLFSYLGRALPSEIVRMFARRKIVRTLRYNHENQDVSLVESDTVHRPAVETLVDARALVEGLSIDSRRVLDERLQEKTYREISKSVGRYRSFVDHHCKQLRRVAREQGWP